MESPRAVVSLPLSSQVEDLTALVTQALASCVGTNGRQERQPFVPRTDLVKFWIPLRIDQVLKAFKPRPWFTVAAILKGYLQIFSLLVYADQLHALVRLVHCEIDDLWLKRDNLGDLLSTVLGGPQYKGARKAILKYQWQFCPVDIGAQQLAHVNLAEDRILPFELGEVLSNKGSATVRKEPYVLKTYKLQEKPSYDQEHAACTLMLSKQSTNLVEYHGCFMHNDTFNLLLQFVNGGDLLRYFAETPRPKTEDDINLFWRSLRSIWRGVHLLHEGHAEHSSQTIDKVVHQDLKPDNILISKGPSESSYHFTPVLTDFGHSCSLSVAGQDTDPKVPDKHGNQEFAAPEASHHAKYLRAGPSTVTSKADIWAMGCIFSVAAVWVVLGPEGVKQYAELRGQETGRSRNFDHSTACFHNGVDLLDAVKTMHNRVSHYCRHEVATPNGGLLATADIVEILETYCLAEEPKNRKSARSIHERLCLLDPRQEPAFTDKESGNETYAPRTSQGGQNTLRVLPVSHGHENTLPAEWTEATSQTTARSIADSSKAASIRQRSVDSLRVPSSSRHDSRLQRAASTGSAVPRTNHAPAASTTPVLHEKNNTLTLDYCRDWMAAKKSSQPIPSDLVDKKIRCIQSNLKDREYVFLMDDSGSMAKHRNDMKKAFDVLSFIAKPMDPNRVELRYASRPDTVYKLNNGFFHTTPFGGWGRVMKSFDDCKFEQLTGHLENHLNRVIRSIIKKQSPVLRERFPTSLFIFTDGMWGVDRQYACGVERCIQQLMDHSKGRRDRTFIMVQFTRFGNDVQGIQHLNYLDKFGSHQDWDIVDHKAVTDDVETIFAGSINQQSDREGEEESVHEDVAHHHRRHSDYHLP